MNPAFAALRALPNNLPVSKNEPTLIIPMRVLIAEDDPALATFVQKGLEAEHYAVDVTMMVSRLRPWQPNWTMTCSCWT